MSRVPMLLTLMVLLLFSFLAGCAGRNSAGGQAGARVDNAVLSSLGLREPPVEDPELLGHLSAEAHQGEPLTRLRDYLVFGSNQSEEAAIESVGDYLSSQGFLMQDEIEAWYLLRGSIKHDEKVISVRVGFLENFLLSQEPVMRGVDLEFADSFRSKALRVIIVSFSRSL